MKIPNVWKVTKPTTSPLGDQIYKWYQLVTKFNDASKILKFWPKSDSMLWATACISFFFLQWGKTAKRFLVLSFEQKWSAMLLSFKTIIYMKIEKEKNIWELSYSCSGATSLKIEYLNIWTFKYLNIGTLELNIGAKNDLRTQLLVQWCHVSQLFFLPRPHSTWHPVSTLVQPDIRKSAS